MQTNDLRCQSLNKIQIELIEIPTANEIIEKLTLFITTMNGKRVLYNIEQAYNMFDINVVGHLDRTTSIT